MSSALLGNTAGRDDEFRLRGCYRLWRLFPKPSTTRILCNSLEGMQPLLAGPTTPSQQRLHAVTLARFRLAPVRSPLLRGSRLLSLPPGTEMFQFPGLPLPVLCVQTGVARHDPCRVSPFGHPRVKRLVGSSPRLIAASYVLHRLLAPRHPPCALSNLATTKDARARYVVLKVPGPVPAPACPDLPAGSGTEVGLRLKVCPVGRSLKTQQCVRPGCGIASPFPSRDPKTRAVLGEGPQLGRVASDRPWSGQAVRAWLPGGPRCEGRACSLERR
jgi:hypothetical protein